MHADRSHFLSLHLIAQADPALSGADLAPATASPLSQVPRQRRWLRRALDGSVV